MIWGECNARYTVAGPAGSQVNEGPAYIDRERRRTQRWGARPFLRVEHPRETFPFFEPDRLLPRDFQQS